MKISENAKVTLTIGQLKKLIKEGRIVKEKEKRSFKNKVILENSSNDYDFMAAVKFILKNRKNMNFIKAVDRTIDTLGETGDLRSAIDMACKEDEETAKIVSEYFKEAYPSAISYEYHPVKGWDGDPEALGSLMDLPQVVVSNVQIFMYLMQEF